jgi:hypothetical protein
MGAVFPESTGPVSRRVAGNPIARANSSSFYSFARARAIVARTRRNEPGALFVESAFISHPLEAAVKSERRSFLRTIPIVLAVAAARSADVLAQAKPAAAGPKLDEGDPQAKALGYVHDASKADKAKFANWKPGEICNGCLQFKGKPKDAFGPCTIFGNKQVAGKGWCTAWQKKA